MSEYTPITGELRAAMRQWGWVESDGSITFATSPMPPSIDAEQSPAISGSDFDRLCDAIDSIHAQLERENAALKAELDRVLGEQEDRSGCIYYDHERHYCSCHDIDTDALTGLPKDADGVPIHIGDAMEHNGVVANVLGITFHGTTPPTVCICRGDYWVEADELHHYVPDTWERIIEDALDGYHDTDFEKLVARCKALCERTKEDA